MCKESKKHLLVSIFTKELSSFFQFLSIVPDTRLPQILVFKLVSVRHIRLYYIQENNVKFYILRELT